MSTRVTHDIGDTIVVSYCLDEGDEFAVATDGGDIAKLTPEQATLLRHHLTVWLEARAR